MRDNFQPLVIRLMKLVQTAAVLVVLAWALPAVAQDTQEPVFDAMATIKVSVGVVAKHHLKKPKIDQPFLARWLKQYLETLDPAKLYFLAKDISEFEKFDDKLPEFKAAKSAKLIKLISKRYQLRVESALQHALDRIDQAFDFTIDESMPLAYEQWPQTNSDRTERWRLQLKYDLLVERSHTSKRSAQIEFLKSRYESIRKQAEQHSGQQALAVYLDSFCLTVDPHSAYISAKEYNNLFGWGAWRGRKTIGVGLSPINGRLMISRVARDFSREPNASKIFGCELLAIRSQKGVLYNCRETTLSTIGQLITRGFQRDESVTLELYDEMKLQRFAVKWPRRPSS